MAILEVNEIHSYYGNIHALKGISLKVEKGEIVSLIGGNGAGKTTFFSLVLDLVRASKGKVIINEIHLIIVASSVSCFFIYGLRKSIYIYLHII